MHRLLWRLRDASRVRLPAAVVSVGNLTVGGSGKTPTVGFLARELTLRGRKTVILSRGVGGRRNRSVNVVSDGERTLMGPKDVGDEPVLLASSAPGVPVLAGRNRAALGYRAAAVFGPEILLLDDGFQHHRLRREVDLLCIDASVGFGNGHVLPRGPLREGRSTLRHADAVVWTRAPQGFDVAAAARRWLPDWPEDRPQFVLHVEPVRIKSLTDGSNHALDWLRGREIGLLAALARPASFRARAQSLGARVVQECMFSDHHIYRRADLRGLRDNLPWLTTGKDAVKIPERWLKGRTLLVLEEEVKPREAGRMADWLLAQLEA